MSEIHTPGAPRSDAPVAPPRVRAGRSFTEVALPLDAGGMIALARARAPREACGLVLATADGRGLRAVELPNRAREPRTGFELDPGALCAWLDRAPARVRGVWHSHPEGPARPSRADLPVFEFAPLQVVVAPGPAGRWVARAFRRPTRPRRTG